VKQFECRTSDNFVFHRHRTKHHGLIDTLQISKKAKGSRRPASCLQALLFSFTSSMHQGNMLTMISRVKQFFCRGFIECSAIECDVKVFVEVL